MMNRNGVGCVHIQNHVNHFLKHLAQIDRALRIFQLPSLDARKVE